MAEDIKVDFHLSIFTTRRERNGKTGGEKLENVISTKKARSIYKIEQYGGIQAVKLKNVKIIATAVKKRKKKIQEQGEYVVEKNFPRVKMVWRVPSAYKRAENL